MRNTLYIVQSVYQRNHHYPELDGNFKLVGWVKRFDAQRYNRATAIQAARVFAEHLKHHKAPDTVLVTPEHGGTPISLTY